MLADTLERYKQRERSLVSDFEKVFPEIYHGIVEDATHDNLVQWVERFSPRRYGLLKCIYCISLLGTRLPKDASPVGLVTLEAPPVLSSNLGWGEFQARVKKKPLVAEGRVRGFSRSGTGNLLLPSLVRSVDHVRALIPWGRSVPHRLDFFMSRYT